MPNLYRLLLSTLALPTLALLLNACGNLDNSTSPAKLSEYENEIKLSHNWSHSLEGRSGLFHKIEPIILDEHIYTVNSDGLISKIRLNDGHIVWQKDLDQKTYAGLAVSKQVIAFANSDGLLSVFTNNAELNLIWQKHLKSEINVQPVIDGAEIFIRLSNGQLNSYNLENGNKNWSVSRRVPDLSLTGTSKPILLGDLVYSGFDNGRLVAFERSSGDVVWEKTIAVPSGRSELDRMVDLDGHFIIKNNIIYVSAFQGRLAAIQTQDGSEIWSRPMSSVKKISADESAIYVSDQESNLWAIDRRSGVALWKQDGLHHRHVTAMSVLNDFIIVADFQGYAHYLDKQTGKFKARIQLAFSKVLNPPLIKQQQVLFLDASNNLISVVIAK